MSESPLILELPQWTLIAFYLPVAGGALYCAHKKLTAARAMMMTIVAALALFGIVPESHALSAMEQKRSRAEFEKYREAAWAHFRKRCTENAGEKVYRTVDHVEGIYLERPRQRPSDADLRNQHWMGDPYGLVVYPPAEISRYLNYLNKDGVPTKRITSRRGFDYVTVPRKDGKFLQYRLDDGSDRLIVAVLDTQPSRYSVTWKDISTEEDRKYWVAGGRLQVIDRRTNELLGERIGYVLESGFGATGGGRVPWLVAQRNACPPIRRNVAKDRLFVDKVLKQHREAAWAHFSKRCANDARETINRVVEDVRAIFLLKLRHPATEAELGDQFWMGDPYGYSSYEASHPIGTYLYDRGDRTISGKTLTPIKGYKYVETHNPAFKEEGSVSRYLRYGLTAVVAINSVTHRPEHRIEPRPIGVNSLLSRYGVTWQDVSTPEDRKYWIAGGKLTIVDLKTKEILAERVGYVIDPHFGSDRQGRRAWLAVGFTPDVFCPKFENRFDRNKEFVGKVLKAWSEK